jgi:hypothetical protein
MYESMISGMTDHIKVCKKSNCCIRLVAESVISGNYYGFINTKQPIGEMQKKEEAQQVFQTESHNSTQDNTSVMP